MRFFAVSLLFTFLSFNQWNVCGQSQSLNFCSKHPFASISLNQTLHRQLSLYTYRNSNVNRFGNTFIYIEDAYSDLPSSALEYEITSTEKGAIVGGVGGLIVDGICGGINNSETNIAVSFLDLFTGEDVSEDVFEKQVSYIVVGTLVGVTVGALTGRRRDRVSIGRKNYFIDFQPALALAPTLTNEMTSGLNISISY